MTILKGLSSEMYLAFDDMYGSFRPKQRTGPFFKFVLCSNDVIKKVYFPRLLRVYVAY